VKTWLPLTIAIIVGSTRPGRNGAAVASWVHRQAAARTAASYEIVDLDEVNLPLLDERIPALLGSYEHQHTKDWSMTVDRADAFVFVTPEYNYGFNAVLKNAIDFLHQEWQHKPVGFVSYGGVAAGTRAVQAIKPIANVLKMTPVPEAVVIPLEGFNLGATVTHPRGASAATKAPAVILLAAANVNDRDGVMSGVPTLGQLAGALADAGFLAIRYDKRGYGQSGGRSESATLIDQAEDVRAVVRWLSNRKDVDPRRIAVVGHGEGAMVGLAAAAREGKIAAVVSIASPSTPGTEQFLEQQRLAVEASNLPAPEREKRLAMQKQVQQAVLTGKGWEGIPANVRRAADTPWFQSVLAYDPAKVLKDVRQPLLIVHGEVDREAPVDHAEKLAALARQGKSKSVDLVIVRGVNHLLTPAVTGNTSEYGTLTDRSVSKDILMTVTGWLTKTLPASAR